MISYILLDIEGTTTPISFVHQVLFPYSASNLADYIKLHANDADVQNGVESTKKTVLEEEGKTIDDDAAINQLLFWIKTDRKHPALKKLQGMIWQHGYESRAFTSEIYDDVLPVLSQWKETGKALGIYSSGSAKAQQLLFRHTGAGDLTPLFSDYFDTDIGHKREKASYHNILLKLNLSGPDVAFLSDVKEELDAAKENSLHTIQLVRPGTQPCHDHLRAETFADADRYISQW